MPVKRVDFYLLSGDKPNARELMVCRLIEKAYQTQHRVFVYCESQKQAEYIDELLWTFKDESFIPHNLQGEGPMPPPPVQIGYTGDAQGFSDILLVLSEDIPACHVGFQRIIEVIADNDEAKITGRIHYRAYKAKQYALQTHAESS